MNTRNIATKETAPGGGRRRAPVRALFCVTALVLLALALCLATPVDAKSQTVSVGIPVEEHPELFLPRSMPTHGTGKIAVFLIEFPDYKNENPVATADYYDRLYFNGGVHTSWGEMSVADFYETQSYGKLKLEGTVFDWYTARHERSYYDNKKFELISEAADFYRAQGVDFSGFDSDGDGVMDAVVFHFAGASSSGMEGPWYSGVTSTSYAPHGYGEIDGLCVRSYVQIDESATDGWDRSIDVICHELMHTLGMPDLYDLVDITVKPAEDLMVGNINFINPYLKMMLGWIDSVKVITEDEKDIRLDVHGGAEPGQIAIVTDCWNGLFDEFYLIAYRKHYQFTTAVIWHIDARLTSDGKSFLYTNERYDPRPDKKTVHSTADFSPYLFIEELSADPDANFVTTPPLSPNQSGFGKDSVLAPDTVPSSDMHGGRFTGIHISNFTGHDKAYLTFDVAFVTDENAPTITTREDDLEFTGTTKIHFNEYIYAGESFDRINVTDLDGNVLDAKIILPNYPNNEMEIQFRDDGYKCGYILNLPKGCLRDSSGNRLPATTLTASRDKYIFPTEEEQLPGTGVFTRSNNEAYFVRQETRLVVITPLWENHVHGTKYEIMQLDLDGQVLSQKIIDSPFKNVEICYSTVFDVGNDCFIVACQSMKSNSYNLFFCLDVNGNIKWVNDTFDKDILMYTAFLRKNELAVRTNGYPEMVYIDFASGKVRTTDFVEAIWGNPFTLSNGKLLCMVHCLDKNGNSYNELRLVNAETYEVELRGSLDSSFTDFDAAYANSDGTYLLYGIQSENIVVCLLDAELNFVKQITVEKMNSRPSEIHWLADGGFYTVHLLVVGNHDNNRYRVRRYDKYLNLIWKSDVVASFVYFFPSASDEMMAYKSMWSPKRECYIERYGSEETYKIPHEHTLAHVEEVKGTCQSEGLREYWYCTDCGRRFADEEGVTLLSDLSSMILPKSTHTETVLPEVPPTCAKTGYTEGKKCSTCGAILVTQQVIPATGVHDFGEWVTTTAPTCTTAGTETRKCTVCGASESREIPATVVHDFGEWVTTKQPTTEVEGEQTRVCRLCGNTETRALDKAEPPARKIPVFVWILVPVAVYGIVICGIVICGILVGRKKAKR